MSKITTTSQDFGPKTIEITTFIILLVLVIGGLLGAFFYDLRQPFVTDMAKHFYNWLIN